MMVLTSSAGLAKLNMNNKKKKNEAIKKNQTKLNSLGSKNYVNSNLMIIRKIKFSDPVKDDRFDDVFNNISNPYIRSHIPKKSSLTFNNFSRSLERHPGAQGDLTNLNNSVERSADILEKTLNVQKVKMQQIQQFQRMDRFDRIDRIEHLPTTNERPKLPSLNIGAKSLKIKPTDISNTGNRVINFSKNLVGSNILKSNIKTEQSPERGRSDLRGDLRKDLKSIFIRESEKSVGSSSPNKKFTFKMGSISNSNINLVSPGKNLPSIQNKNNYVSKNNKFIILKFIIKRGNNKELIKTILLRRSNWKEASSDFSTIFNFKWSNSRKKTEYTLFKLGINCKRVRNHK
jgi:hypothetical protein